MNSNEELILVQSILKGKTFNYEQLVNKYNKKLFGYIYKMVKNEHAAEELTHETFIKAYKNLNSFDQSRSFSVWLFAIGRNLVMDYFKYNSRHVVYELKEELDLDNTADASLNPENIIERKENKRIVDDVINCLPHNFRELIILKYFEGLSYQEIAERLHLSSNEVKWKLHQARKKMVQYIEKDGKLEGRCNAYGM